MKQTEKTQLLEHPLDALVKWYTASELVTMPNNEFRMLKTCLNIGAFRLLGINYKKFVRVHECPKTLDLIIEYA